MLFPFASGRGHVAAFLASLALATATACAPGSSPLTTGSTSGAGGDGEGGEGDGPATSSTGEGAGTATATVTAAATTTASSGDPSSSGQGAGGEGTGGEGDQGGGGGGTGGEGDQGGGGSGGAPECITPDACPETGTFCADRTCIGGDCGVENVDDGTEHPDQLGGDCVTVVCDGDGDVRDEPDGADLPDDQNPCTVDGCLAGAPDFQFEDEGTPCGTNLFCDANGTCVGCVVPDDCPGTDTECATRTCDAGTCGVTFTAAGTELVSGQIPFDCQSLECDGAGQIITVDADGDSPPDLEDCVVESCTAGQPSSTPVGAGAPCDDDGGSICNGNGACVDCLDADDCGTDDTCNTYSCTAGACGVAYAPVGTPVGDPDPGDCRRDECGAQGTIATDVPFNTDVPIDGAECTGDVCTNGNPSNPNLPINTLCTEGGGIRCDAMGNCVECTTGGQCASGICSGGACVPAQCDDGVLNGTETGLDCGGPVCGPCPIGQGCGGDGDCASGFCNPTTDLCAQPVCGDGFMNGAETDIDCGGGTCADCGLGFGCLGDSDCVSDFCFEFFCATPICGDGQVDPGEICDDGDSTDGNGCDNDCTFSCGNGVVNANNTPPEICDDADGVSGDGCSSTCQIEPFYQCGLALPSVCTRQEVLCANGTDNDGDGLSDANDPDCAFNQQGIVACPSGTLYTFNSVRVPQSIPDLSTITNDIRVHSIGNVTRAMLRINITHTWDADLDITLTSPNATLRNVALDRGGSGDNFLNTRFRQASANLIGNGTAPFNGEYRPDGNFDGFNGGPALGWWRLTITDDLGGDVGALQSYSIALCAQ